MKYKILFLVALSTALLFSDAPKRLMDDHLWDYQSIVVNGKVIFDTERCSGSHDVISQRYEAMKKVLDKYKRPFKVLDIGANNGFFSLKIAEDYEACCVMVDNSQRLSDICTLNTERNNIIHLKQRFSLSDLKKLAKEEHFDVIMVHYVLHHVKEDWKEWFETLLSMADQVIVSIPPKRTNPQDKRSLMEKYFLERKDGQYLGTFDRGRGAAGHMLWFSTNPDFEKQTHPIGIKPSTYWKFNGNFPSPEYVTYLEKRLKKENTSSWVLQGVDYIPLLTEKLGIGQGGGLNLSQAKPAPKQLNLKKLGDAGGS